MVVRSPLKELNDYPYGMAALDTVIGAIEYNRDIPLVPFYFDLKRHEEAIRQAEAAQAAAQAGSETPEREQ